MVASGMSNHLVETRPTSQGSGGGFLMFQEPKQNHRWMPCFVTCFGESRPFRTSWIMPKIMENHVESHWKTTEIKSNNYFPPKKKVIDHPPICTLSNAGVPDSPPETQHLKSSLMIGTQRPSGPSRLPTERTWITHKGLTSCGNLVALKEHKVKKKHIFLVATKKMCLPTKFPLQSRDFWLHIPKSLDILRPEGRNMQTSHFLPFRVSTCRCTPSRLAKVNTWTLQGDAFVQLTLQEKHENHRILVGRTLLKTRWLEEEAPFFDLAFHGFMAMAKII